MVNSATAIAFWPGTLATWTAASAAASTSMVLVPAPALTTSPRESPDSIASALTAVDLTTKTL